MSAPAWLSRSKLQNFKSMEKGSSSSCIIVREAKASETASKATEIAFACVGILAMLDGLLIGLLAAGSRYVHMAGGPFVAGAGFIALGLALYAFGTRGVRRQVKLDIEDNKIEFGRINSNYVSRLSTEIPVEMIESVYIKKSQEDSNRALLMLRKRGRSAPYTLLAGQVGELRGLHEEICRLVNPASNAVAPRPRRVRSLRKPTFASRVATRPVSIS